MTNINLRKTAKSLWQDESAQGATEYILLLTVVVALIVIFRQKIIDTVKGLVDSLSGKINEATQ